jgi:PEGA domain-containing protein
MTIARDLSVDRFPRVQGTQEHLASWYAQGLSDGLGDRLLMFDNTNAPSWELLRFRPEFGSAIRFEVALRERVERLGRFRHPSFTIVRSVEELGSGDGLALVATYAPGRRLSEAFSKAHSAGSVVRLLRQLTPALAALQHQGDDIAHGALTADRIMVTTDGRLIIREHVLGSALERLGLSAARLWADLAIVVPPTSKAVPPLDRRTDVLQLALIALSLRLGHRIGPEEYPEKIGDLLDQIAETADSHSSHLFPALRPWLERALQLNGQGFEGARDALEALCELPADRPGADEYLGLLATQGRHRSSTKPGSEARPPLARLPSVAEIDSSESQSTFAADPIEQFKPETELAIAPPRAQDVSGPPPDHEPRQSFFDRPRRLRWLTAAVAVLAIGEAALIGRLLYIRSLAHPPADTAIVVEFARPGAEVLVDGRSAGVTPLELKVGSSTRSIRLVSHEPPGTEVAAQELPVAREDRRAPRPSIDARAANDLRSAVRPQRSGGVRVSSPFELHILEDERLLGSSAEGPMVTTAGRHEFDLVNSALGYRSRRVVDIKPGQIVSLAVTPANGSVSINALPWAEVWIDGHSVGETPLGNLSVPLGEHEIVFRHPELGERREKAIVRSDRLTRVSANLQR